MSGGSLINGIEKMRIRMIDCDTKETWLYNVYWDSVKKNLRSYERLYIMDDELLDSMAIQMAVEQHFGKEFIFQRNTEIHDYICGKIKHNNSCFKDILVFYEE